MTGVQDRAPRPFEAGFSLIDALVAMAIVVTGVAAVAQLFVLAAHGMAGARAITVASVLAAQKLEELRSVAYTLAPDGSAVTDPALVPSPPGSLAENTPGFVEHLDAAGRVVGADAAPPSQSVYVRRWSVEPLPASMDPLLIRVVVLRTGRRALDASLASVRARSVR
jgi:Tfp pilus assembly protein PilV